MTREKMQLPFELLVIEMSITVLIILVNFNYNYGTIILVI